MWEEDSVAASGPREPQSSGRTPSVAFVPDAFQAEQPIPSTWVLLTFLVASVKGERTPQAWNWQWLEKMG